MAERIAKAIGTKAISIQEVTGETLTDVHGMVSPTYGTTPGASWYLAQEALQSGSDIFFDAFFGVRMPDTWTPLFNLSG